MAQISYAGTCSIGTCQCITSENTVCTSNVCTCSTTNCKFQAIAVELFILKFFYTNIRCKYENTSKFFSFDF